MDATLYDLVEEYYKSMSAEGMKKAKGDYFEPLRVLPPDIKLPLLLTAMNALDIQVHRRKFPKEMHRVAEVALQHMLPQVICTLAKEHNVSPKTALEGVVEASFKCLKNGKPYMFAHSQKGIDGMFAQSVSEQTIKNVQRLINSCEKEIPVSARFLGEMSVLSIRHGYKKIIPFFLKKLQNMVGNEVVQLLEGCGVLKSDLEKQAASHELVVHTKRDLTTSKENNRQRN